MEKNYFEIAAKNKYRFPHKGMIPIEDLFDLTLEELDSVYKIISANMKAVDSLLNVNAENEHILNKIEILRIIVREKQEWQVRQNKIKESRKEMERLKQQKELIQKQISDKPKDKIEG